MDMTLAIFAINWLALSWATATSTSARNCALRAVAAVGIVWLAPAAAVLAGQGSGAV